MSSFRFLPYDAFIIETNTSVPRLMETLQEHVEPRKWIRWGWSRDHKPFQGEVTEEGFKTSRVIHYRNSFLPYLAGKFEQGPLGTAVRVKMQLHPFVILFGIIWVGFVAQFFLLGLRGVWNNPEATREIGGFLLIPLGMLLFFYLLTTLAFKYEARKARRALDEILNPYTIQRFGPE